MIVDFGFNDVLGRLAGGGEGSKSLGSESERVLYDTAGDEDAAAFRGILSSFHDEALIDWESGDHSYFLHLSITQSRRPHAKVEVDCLIGYFRRKRSVIYHHCTVQVQ